MKCHKYWVRETREIHVYGKRQTVTLIVGSDISKEDAARNVEATARGLEKRISTPRDKRETYETDIKEHVVRELDDKNIITVNRYGAWVLNTTAYTILDIDHCPFEWMDLFRKSPGTQKDKMVSRFKRRISRYPELGDTFRIYETFQGIRIIGKTYYDPQERHSRAIMRRLNVDALYVLLSRKQNCYRARLTPKPFRMKAATIRIKTPLDCETETYASWQRQYEEASQRFSVVRLRETIGNDFGHDPAIAFHDQTTRMDNNKPLA